MLSKVDAKARRRLQAAIRRAVAPLGYRLKAGHVVKGRRGRKAQASLYIESGCLYVRHDAPKRLLVALTSCPVRVIH